MTFVNLEKERDKINLQLEWRKKLTKKQKDRFLCPGSIENELKHQTFFIWKVDFYLPNIIFANCLTDLSNIAGVIYRWKR